MERCEQITSAGFGLSFVEYAKGQIALKKSSWLMKILSSSFSDAKTSKIFSGGLSLLIWMSQRKFGNSKEFKNMYFVLVLPSYHILCRWMLIFITSNVKTTSFQCLERYIECKNCSSLRSDQCSSCHNHGEYKILCPWCEEVHGIDLNDGR